MDRLKKWAIAAGMRAIKTAAQAALGVIGASTALGTVDWVLVASTAALAVIASLLMSLAGLPEVDEGTSPLKKTKKTEE